MTYLRTTNSQEASWFRRSTDVGTLEKVGKNRGLLGFARGPILDRKQINVEIAGPQIMKLAVWYHAMGEISGRVRMGLVVAWNDARRHLDRIEFLLGHANDRQIGARHEVTTPARHHVDELRGIEGEQPFPV